MKTFNTYVLPAYYASALVNNDYSGVDSLAECEIKHWLANIQPGYCVDCSEPFFSHNNDMNNFAGDVCNFKFVETGEEYKTVIIRKS